MTCVYYAVDDAVATQEPRPDPAVPPRRENEPRCCGLRLRSPPDALTRMLMKADGVTEVDLDALLRRVAKAREKLRIGGDGGDRG